MPGPAMIFNAMKATALQKKSGLTPLENTMLAYHHKTPAWIPCVYTDFWFLQPKMEGERYCGHDRGKDWFGVEWVYEAEVGAPMPVPGQYLFEDIADWKKYVRFPDLDAIDWKKQAEEDLHTDLIKTMAAGKRVYSKKSIVDPKKAGLAMVLNGMFERLHSMMGFENALVGLLEDPDAAFEYFSAMADHKIRFFQKIGKHYPVQVINAHDDYGAEGRMLMSPETWRELIKPNLKRMVDACHEMGILYQHHSCGYIEPIIPDLIEIGVDALDPLQVCNTNIRAIKDKYQSRLTFVGGIDNMGVLEQPDATPAARLAEYDRAADLLAPGGSFIAFPHVADFSLVPDQVGEHFRYGVPFYKKRNLGPWKNKKEAFTMAKVPLAAGAKKKSYYHFYEREMAPVPEERLAFLSDPWQNDGKGLEYEDRNKIFDPGYLPGEVGLFKLKKGGFQVANRTKFKGCTGEMLQWWFGWHALDPLRYAIWDPYDHYGLEISDKDRAYILDTNTSIPDKGRNVTHTVRESLGVGQKPDKIIINFADPADLGFNKKKIFTDKCSFFVCAHAVLGPIKVIMMHMARDTEDGCELRSRFWMGYGKDGKVKMPFFIAPIVKKKMTALLAHNFTEYANLASILPEVYAQEKDNW